MEIYPTDHVVTVTVKGEVEPKMIECLGLGAFPWQLRGGWEGSTITLAFENICTILVAVNKIGLVGGEIVAVTHEMGRSA